MKAKILYGKAIKIWFLCIYDLDYVTLHSTWQDAIDTFNKILKYYK